MLKCSIKSVRTIGINAKELIVEFRQPLTLLCLRTDAQIKSNGLSPVATDVIDIVLHNSDFWKRLQHLIKFLKPLVDAIGNIESRNTNLADCMLELLRCARTLQKLETAPTEELDFSFHARTIFNRRFQTMDTNIHSLALFLHPLCRRLAVSHIVKGRSLDAMIHTALQIAHKWRWQQARAGLLVDNLRQYFQCQGPFIGGQQDGLGWWKSLAINPEQFPLKAFAIVILSVVPHAGEVERLFSALGGVQSNRRCNLAVKTFESLGKARSNYCYKLWERDRQAGKSSHRKHAHMHTRNEKGINIELAKDLEENFTSKPPFDDEDIQDTEGISPDEIDKAFEELEKQLDDERNTASFPSTMSQRADVLQGQVYNMDELERIEQGLIPATDIEELDVIGSADEDGWNVEGLMSSKGLR